MDLLSYFMDLSQMIYFLAPCFCSELKVLNESKYSMPGVCCAFGNVFFLYLLHVFLVFQGLLGMTFGSLGTGMDNYISEVREQEENGKNPFPNFRNGKGMKKNISKHQERKGNEKIQSYNPGTGIRYFHSREWRRTGIPARQCGIFTFLRV